MLKEILETLTFGLCFLNFLLETKGTFLSVLNSIDHGWPLSIVILYEDINIIYMVHFSGPH